jgi:hypothetical protein
MTYALIDTYDTLLAPSIIQGVPKVLHTFVLVIYFPLDLLFKMAQKFTVFSQGL